MRSPLRARLAPLALLTLLTLLCGGLYPLAVTALAELAFPWQAHGSPVPALAAPGGLAGPAGSAGTVASALVGQAVSAPDLFWGRPSAAPKGPYDARLSGGANLGPSNPALVQAVRDRVQRLRAAEPGAAPAAYPVDLVTASASGLDPHLSPAAALAQAPRVAAARHLPEDRIRALVAAHVEPPFLGFVGEARVSVLALNLALTSGEAP